MSTNFEPILPGSGASVFPARPLLDCVALRALEASAKQTLPQHALMQRAGLAVARFAMAIAPHARTVWLACGPGNNGGDGFEAARHLAAWGKKPFITAPMPGTGTPADAAACRTAAQAAGIEFAIGVPPSYDLCIDALFGIGHAREFEGDFEYWVDAINQRCAPVLAVDLPSGLDADSGRTTRKYIQADYTLSLLALKPGMFTGNGRDACGRIWLHRLGLEDSMAPACAELNPTPITEPRPHHSHKGSYGDVGIIGGATGMTGAALLAARGALHGGAGRVYAAVLQNPPVSWDPTQPEIMFRNLEDLHLETMTVVAGCGAGKAIHAHLETILKRAARLVLDADGLNALAQSPTWQNQLASRPAGTTVLTPHPLEAARLLQVTSAQVQADRLSAAQTLARRFSCTVVLKGSGTVIAAPETLARINPTGNARLATAGTGDVLAGMIGARITSGTNVFGAACAAVHWHGAIADQWPDTFALDAGRLAAAQR